MDDTVHMPMEVLQMAAVENHRGKTGVQISAQCDEGQVVLTIGHTESRRFFVGQKITVEITPCT